MLIQRFGFRASFLGLAGIALLAFALLWLAVPETLASSGQAIGSAPQTLSHETA
jgi:predicted MFS family arabinose efflux permease